jgi:hypothetical protein
LGQESYFWGSNDYLGKAVLERIKKAPLPEKERKEFYLQTHKEFVLKTEPLRERINKLNEPSQRNLLNKISLTLTQTGPAKY